MPQKGSLYFGVCETNPVGSRCLPLKGDIRLNIAAEIARPEGAGVSPVLARLRAATGAEHQRLEERLDAVARLADPYRRGGLIRRYAALHIPAEASLSPHLSEIEDLEFETRRRTSQLHPFAGDSAPVFPAPASLAEALGMFYVLEGSTLGGRMILRDLAERGVSDPALSFLDPYGSETGMRWRQFLAVLARETGDNQGLILQACRGALTAFRHAERVLCGDLP
jgi:heme oxygenase (biliverdin-IX-beta and delta-forming)